ncbi:uncharacterized protein LOC127840579 [Dreissena polymorpha]|uniref:uncharacterized protein LOC127840579 n=1 Tax=Dreissena polymorpha TaxID=45954 RepID=UPI002263CB46|nr:uncharacterized protein LOC127840579 [Dreissena polymorpha]
MNRSYPCASFWNSPRVKFINFIDYEEAIDNVDRQFILRQPRHYGKPENVINIIRKSHVEMPLKSIHVRQLTDGFEVRSPERQSCMLSHFLLVIESGMTTAKDHKQIGIVCTLWKLLEDLDFAEDLALLSNSLQQMQKMA